MTGKEFLDNQLSSVVKIGVSDKTISLWQEIRKGLSNFIIVDSFAQIRKDEKVEGLALELLLFNKEYLIDIVVSRKNIYYTTILLKSIVEIEINNSYDDLGLFLNFSDSDTVKLSIGYGGGEKKIIYISDSKKFEDFLRIKENLLNTLADAIGNRK